MQPLNPCELKIDLFCKGIRISPQIAEFVQPTERIRSGLGSGIELTIPGKRANVWLNAPANEEFAASSPYLLNRNDKCLSGGERGDFQFEILDERNQLRYPAKVQPDPGWYDEKTSSGLLMGQLGLLQGTFLSIYIGPVCRYWVQDAPENCCFCTTGLDEPRSSIAEKSVQDVIETCQAAFFQSHVRFVLLNSGFQEGKGLQMALPFVKAIKTDTDLSVGLQLAPLRDWTQYDELISLGVDHFSFCFEFMSEGAFTHYCPGKARTLGQEAFFEAMEYTSAKLGPGKVSGEIIAGVEPIEETLRAIDLVTEMGAFPLICVFRPLEGSGMQCYPSPFYEEIREVAKYMSNRLIKRRIPASAMPKADFSLAIQPRDAFYLANRNLDYFVYRLYNRIRTA
jgi:hypothetical protein